jgi:hypothetical protein
MLATVKIGSASGLGVRFGAIDPVGGGGGERLVPQNMRCLAFLHSITVQYAYVLACLCETRVYACKLAVCAHATEGLPLWLRSWSLCGGGGTSKDQSRISLLIQNRERNSTKVLIGIIDNFSNFQN